MTATTHCLLLVHLWGAGGPASAVACGVEACDAGLALRPGCAGWMQALGLAALHAAMALFHATNLPMPWQVLLWEAGGPATAASSDEEAYDAALALVAAGVLTHAPRALRAAAALLKQLDAREGRCAACPRCPALNLPRGNS